MPFSFPANTSSSKPSEYHLKNCAFAVVPDDAVEEDAEQAQLTLSVTTLDGQHLGVFFGVISEIADSEEFAKHTVDLLNQDGVFAQAEILAAVQTRWM